MTNRRIYETIGIRYDDIHQLERIVNEVKEMLRTHPDIDTGQTLIVNFNRFNDSSLDFFVYTFTKTTDWVAYHQIKQDVLLKIAAIIEAAGAEIAYPTQRLQLEQLMNAEHPEKPNSN
jgi:MscS family membrane protein